MKLLTEIRNRYLMLSRDRHNAVIAGVCSGLAAWLKVDRSITRILFVFLTFISGTGLILYLLLYFLMSDDVKSFIRNKQIL